MHNFCPVLGWGSAPSWRERNSPQHPHWIKFGLPGLWFPAPFLGKLHQSSEGAFFFLQEDTYLCRKVQSSVGQCIVLQTRLVKRRTCCKPQNPETFEIGLLISLFGGFGAFSTSTDSYRKFTKPCQLRIWRGKLSTPSHTTSASFGSVSRWCQLQSQRGRQRRLS